MNNTGKELKVEQTKLDCFMNQIRNIYGTQENIKRRMEEINTRVKRVFVGEETAVKEDNEKEMPDSLEHAFSLIETQQKEMLEILDNTGSLV